MEWKRILPYLLYALGAYAVCLLGIYSDKFLKRKNAFMGLLSHFIVLLVLFGGAYAMYLHDMGKDKRSTYSDTLESGKRILLPTEKPAITTLEIGWTLDRRGPRFHYMGGPLSTVFDISKNPFIEVFEDIALTIGEIDGKLKVSVLVRDETGRLIAQIRDNEWAVAPPPRTFDRNYTSNMLEVVNEEGEVVLQVRVLQDRIQLNGVFYGSNGKGIAVIPGDYPIYEDWMAIQMIDGDHKPTGKIRPIFKYPSRLHLGELAARRDGID